MDSPKLINHSNQINGLYQIELGSFKDNRGENFEIFDLDFTRFNNNFQFIWSELGIDFSRSLVSASVSKKDVIRGGHGQQEGYKMVLPLGDIQFFIVDINPLSNTFRRTAEFNITEDKHSLFLLPPYTLNFHGCLGINCLFLYFWQNGYVNQENQLSGKWDKFGLPWKIEKPILSERDK